MSQKRKFLDTDHPAFRPLWLRIVIVTVTAVWGIVEFFTGSPFWAVLFLGIAGYAIWGFFFDFNPRDDGGA